MGGDWVWFDESVIGVVTSNTQPHGCSRIRMEQHRLVSPDWTGGGCLLFSSGCQSGFPGFTTLFLASCFKILQNSPKPSGALERVEWRWRSSVPGVVQPQQPPLLALGGLVLARVPQSTSDQGLAYSPLIKHRAVMIIRSASHRRAHGGFSITTRVQSSGSASGLGRFLGITQSPVFEEPQARFHLAERLRQRPVSHIQSRSEITGESQKCHNQMLLFNLKSFYIRQEKPEQGRLCLNR